MLSKGAAYFPYWLAELKLNNLFYSLPYKWEEKSQKIVLIPKKTRPIYLFTLFAHITYLAIMCLHMGLNHRIMSLSNCLKGMVVIGTFSTCLVPRLTFYLWEEEGRNMLNAFLQFEKKLFIRKIQMKTKI